MAKPPPPPWLYIRPPFPTRLLIPLSPLLPLQQHFSRMPFLGSAGVGVGRFVILLKCVSWLRRGGLDSQPVATSISAEKSGRVTSSLRLETEDWGDPKAENGRAQTRPPKGQTSSEPPPLLGLTFLQRRGRIIWGVAVCDCQVRP